MKRTGLIAVTVTLLAVCAVAAAQEERPWERPGIEAGQEIIGPDGGVMVWVPAGEFTMGITDEQAAEWLEEWPERLKDFGKFVIDAATPQRRVEMDGYWLGKHEVTNAQYRAFCEATGREFPERSEEGDDHPVVYVNWDDAKAYAEHYGLRLPTEAEWEYAARGPDGRNFPWGNEWDPQKLCWRENQGPGGQTFPVGSFPDGASWVGALDMAGNVSEWCADWYDPNYYKTGPTTNPSGPSEAVALRVPLDGRTLRISGARVARGGSWNDGGHASFYCADRGHADHRLVPSSRSGDFGFRCARGVEVAGE